MDRNEAVANRRRIGWVVVAGSAVAALVCWQALAQSSAGKHIDASDGIRGTPLNSPGTSSATIGAGRATEVAPAELTPVVDENGTTKITMQFLANYRHPRIPLRSDDDTPKAPAKPSADPVPKEIRALSGRRVSVPGYMLAIDYSEEECTEFALSGCPPGCCFGASMLPNGWVSVTMSEGKKARCIGSPRFVRVEGILEVHGRPSDDAEGTPVYTITADVVSDAKGLR